MTDHERAGSTGPPKRDAPGGGSPSAGNSRSANSLNDTIDTVLPGRRQAETTLSGATTDLVERARRVSVASVIARRRIELRRVTAIEWAGPCPVCGGTDRFAINLRKNVWNCRRCARGGDAIALVEHLDRCDFRAAVAQLAEDEWPEPEHGPAPKAVMGEPERTAQGLEIFSEGAAGHPILRAYLTSRQLILTADVLATDALRFHPRCPFKLKDGTTIRLPAMVGLMRDVLTDEPRAIHRTALKPDGSGREKTLPDGTNGKKMLGPAKGAAVKLIGDDAVTIGLALAEGIETALTAICAGWLPGWAAGSKGAIEAFPVLPGIEHLTIFADADDHGGGLESARACTARWQVAGHGWTILLPPRDGCDWNDLEAGR